MIATAYVLLGLAVLLILSNAYPAALLLCIAVGLLALMAPPTEAEQAALRNHARKDGAR